MGERQLKYETEHIHTYEQNVKNEPNVKKVKERPEINQQLKGVMTAKPEVVYVKVDPLAVVVDTEIENQGQYEPQLETSVFKRTNAPVLSQSNISQILNNSDYEDDSSNEDSDTKFHEHETDGSSEESDEDQSDERFEEQTHLWVGHCIDEDLNQSGYDGNGTRLSQSTRNWLRTRFRPAQPTLHQPAYLPNICSSTKDALEYFNEYFDDTLYDTIVKKTNQTAMQKQGKPLNFTRIECKTFFGIIITMSCINYPNIRMYWNRKWAIDLIAKAMARDRFLTLKQSLKLVVDDDITEEMRAADHLWKVRPIINRVLEGCHKQERQQNISIDEMIIPLKGFSTVKQFCVDKHNPTGIKVVVLVNPNGIICDFVTYQGKDNLVEEIVLFLTRTLVPGHVLYFNRHFTTIELAEELNRNGFKCVGALMKSRLPREVKADLISDKLTKKDGSHDVLVSSDGELAITKWINNKPLFFLSTLYAAEAIGICKRYDRKRRRTISIPRPEVAKEYKSNTAGLGVTERLLATCNSKTRMNKWTLRFIHHFIDLAVANSWIKYKKDMQTLQVSVHKIYQLWEFKRLIGEQLIESSLNTDSDGLEDEEILGSRRAWRPSAPIPSKVKRTRGNEHLPEVGTVQRCKNSGCDMKTTVSCITCKLHLCLTRKRNCFKQFHTDGS